MERCSQPCLGQRDLQPLPVASIDLGNLFPRDLRETVRINLDPIITPVTEERGRGEKSFLPPPQQKGKPGKNERVPPGGTRRDL